MQQRSKAKGSMAPSIEGLRARKMTSGDWGTAHSTGTRSLRRGIKKRRKLDPMTLMMSFLLLPVITLVYVATSYHSHSNIPDRSSELPELPFTSDPLERILDRNPALRERPVLTAFLEDSSNLLGPKITPLPQRKTRASDLNQTLFPQVNSCSQFFQTWPIDNYPLTDPYLPWIHDVFPSSDGANVNFVAQNRRRCSTGIGLEHEMKFWEPQMALFQPVPVVEEDSGRIRLASSYKEATFNETRFICHFQTLLSDQVYRTMSSYQFNYEYISWRKGKDSMYMTEGKDNVQFWLSQLLFQCPIPSALQNLIRKQKHIKNDTPLLYIDLVPIRTPPRFNNPLFTVDHVGAEYMSKGTSYFDLKSNFGTEHYLPAIIDSGRWANIPICQSPERKQHRLVACTWTASSYTRRGDVVGVSDTEARVREWIIFHKMVGFDHIYVYDNTAPGVTSSLKQISDEFPGFVHYHRWPCSICNNNRPSHKNPGERSSQYAAEASCRERYGPSTDWMAFIDTDEYLIPTGSADTWEPLLDKYDEEGTHILKMRSSRAKPRMEYLTPMKDQSLCVDPNPKVRKPPGKAQDCLAPSKSSTFLQVYNCEYIRPPRPERFERAMKQIYRPDYVQSHFVHYSTVTKDISRYKKDFGPDETYIRKVHRKDWEDGSPEVFLDELSEGLLVHTRSVLPHESQYREQGCKNASKYGCAIGMVCPDTTAFVDAEHQDNIFADDKGNYCNCWKNSKVEDVYVPKLTELLKQHILNVNTDVKTS